MEKRRTYVHPAPPRREPESPAPDGVMWPDDESGFEADQFSPAGEIQALSQFGRALRRPGAIQRAWRFNAVTKVMTCLLLVVAFVTALAIAVSIIAK